MLNFNNIKKTTTLIRIVFVVENGFTIRDYERFYINELKDNGFEVLIVDVKELIYGQVGDSLNKKSIDINYTECKSIKEFCEIVKEFKPNFSVNLVLPAKSKYLSRFIIALYLNRKSKLIEYSVVNLPLDLNFLLVKKAFKNILFFPWVLIRIPYSIVTNQNSIRFARRKLIKLHENDYDLYLKSLGRPKKDNKIPYLLFLDEGGPYHTDFIYQRIKSPLIPEIYYPEINKALIDLAENLKLQPLVQLHPRVDGDYIKKYYQIGISNDTTVDAIRDASLIVAHSSTAIQIAVLFQKPIILLKTTQLLEFKTSKLLINNFAKLLKCPCIWPEEASQIRSIPSVNIDSYLEYQNQYTKIPNTPNEFNCKILIQFLVKEHNLNS